MTSSIVTVLTPSPTYDLTTVERVKLELGITDTVQDALLTYLVHEESESMADLLSRTVASETVTEEFRLNEGWPNRIMLDRYPVTNVASVTEWVSNPDLPGTVLTASDYQLDAGCGDLFRLDTNGYRTSWYATKIVAVYTGGYELLATLPRKIEAATLALIKSRWFGRRRDPALTTELIFDVGRWDYRPNALVSDLPPEVTDAIEIYQDPRGV